MKKIISDIKTNKLLLLFSLIEGFLTIYGILLQYRKSLSDINVFYVAVILFFSCFFYLFNRLYFSLLDLKFKRKDNYDYSKKSFIIIWFIIFVLWIPVLLAYYPTLWAYDVYKQVPHIIGDQITTQHPIVHTLFIELVLSIGKIIKNYTFGMLLLSIIQMLIMSCIFSYSIEKIRSKINNKLIRSIITIVLIVYYGIVPFNSIMSISMTKDVLFSGLLLLLIIYIYDFIEEKNIKKKKYVLFVIVSILFLVLKNNSLFIFSLFLLCFIIFYKGNMKKNIIIMSTISIITSLMINFSLQKLTCAKEYSKFEKYNVQIQNLMYVAIKHPKENENSNYLFDIIPKKCFEKVLYDDFDENRVDYVKDKLINCNLYDFNYDKLNKKWIKYGIKYPIDYIDSWSNVTIGSWYLLDENHANTYPGKNQGYLLTDYKRIPEISITRPNSKFQILYDKLEKYATDNYQYKGISLFRFIFEPATYVLSFFLMLIYIINRKLKNELIPLILLIGVYISILDAPVIIVRYIYPFMISVPIIFTRLFLKQKGEA